jgi:hypothetical membrane protein
VTHRQLALLGLASVGVILLGMIVAALPYQGHAGEAYWPLNHFVSELGETPQSRLAWVFNLGLVVGGSGLGLFLLLLAQRLAGLHRTALTIVGTIAGASGALVGVFPMNLHGVHGLVALTFFLTGWIVTAIVSAWILAGRRPSLPRWLIVPGAIVMAVSWVFVAVYSTYRPANPSGPIANRPDGLWAVTSLEWASLLTLLAWFVCVSIALLREPAD